MMIEEASLSSLFKVVHRAMNNNSYETISQEELLKLTENVEKCEELVRTEALFSSNEILEDIHTENLKFLSLSYYRAKALLSLRDMDTRRVNVLQAKASFGQFLHICTQHMILHESELKKMENARMTAEERRNAKIEKFKREKAAKQRIQELTRFLAITKEDSSVDHEDELRELYLLTLQSQARDSVDELDLIEQELQMLKVREEELEYLSKHTNLSSNNSNSNAPQGSGSIIPPGSRALDPHRPGIEVTRTFKVGDQIMMSRDNVKAQVFGDRIAPPTISLEEFGELELQAAMERQQREVEAQGEQGPRRYRQLEEEGEEDNAELVERAAEEDRKWDDWKDQNPRGWGNKMGKRF